MMAFLLDIITFLQISFSTNIFRINYSIVYTDTFRSYDAIDVSEFKH
ncbi:transposase [Francisella tularensis]|uniref:50S rRNA methyltransferase n=1 Tax=Francisella tularensis subsp. holarctica (strain LVS) TaxID=376619 RepID=A0ABF7PR10_FRATH|nr:hypothetical protein FTS_0313 [Francisella tularensis subsp. holarctica FSC200]KXO24925.1 transposase [Francisella tularensis]CAJ78754.1 hypothetical protein FTL_0313 [Francisella tularensis subsp. holarctica LVS]KXO33922.1 transposase [Francisella tularensis]KXO36024.1 transposase [Francisella tularensis]